MHKLLLLLFALVPFFSIGQNVVECAADEMQALYEAKNPLAKHSREKMEAEALRFFQNRRSSDPSTPGQHSKVLSANFVIPVVVHIIHQNGPENISDVRVIEAIRDLNDGFARTGRYAQSNGAASNIQFCLARRDPDGKQTTGINRVESPLTNTTLEGDEALKSVIHWNSFDYLNIWVVNTINGGNILGYANFPQYFHGTDNDGIVVDDQAMGRGSATLLHEAGHYFALYHTFTGGCQNDDCLKNGDLVCDTPPDNTTTFSGCNTAVNSCSTDALSGFATDQNDINWNYMDYGNGGCRTGFTQGQVDRMHYFLETGRSSLLVSKSCLLPCFDPLTASFSASKVKIEVGQTVNFTNTSINANTYQWLKDGVVFSTAENASLKFNAEGVYNIALVASNSDIACTETFSVAIEVVCPLRARFSASDPTPVAGSTVNFVNASDQGFYEWFVDGIRIAKSTNTSYLFPTVGEYEVSLVAQTYTETCYDTFSLKMKVSCLEAAYSVNNLYPKPNELVNFLNKSAGATNFAWTINGQPVGTDKNLDYRFAAEGVYAVCLEATSPSCTDRFCTTVLVYASASGGCNGTFVKRFGAGAIITMENMLPVPEGGYFLTGGIGQKALLIQMRGNGEVAKARVFDPTSEKDNITLLLLDSDRHLLLGGASTKEETIQSLDPTGFFLMKYDYVNDTILWVHRFPEQVYWTRFGSLLENGPGGNYLAFGQVSPRPPQTDYRHFVMELDRNTGETIATRQYGLSAGSFRASVLHKDAIYTVGNNGTNPVRGKASLSKYDRQGRRQWTYTYFNTENHNSSAEFSRILVGNDTLLLFGYGRLTSPPNAEGGLFLAKTDLEGKLLWSKQYRIFQSLNVRANSILPLPDGYILAGNATIGVSNPYREIQFLMRIDKQGNVVWAKQFFYYTNYLGECAISQDSFLHISAGLWNTLTKTTLNGELTGSTCDIISALNVTASDIPSQNRIQNLYAMSQSAFDFLPEPASDNKSEIAIATWYSEDCICTDPVDSCLLFTDAMLTAATATCRGDSMLVQLHIYNNGTVDVPAGTPLAFYQGDPTAGAAALWSTQTLPRAVKQMESRSFSFTMPAWAATPIFVVVNDNASTPAPWTLDNFPNKGNPECFFQNNLGRFQVPYTTPTLDLGPDIAVCDFGVATFRAGAGFADYTWQDGSKDPDFTAWLPGKYWVRAVDSCGGVHTDTVTVTVDPGTVAEIGVDSATICAGEQVAFGVNGFEQYQWEPATGLDCSTCASVLATPDASTLYRLTAKSKAGCYSSDSVWVHVLPGSTTTDIVKLCPGDSILVFGTPVDMPGTYVFQFTGQNGCDSSHIVRVLLEDTIYRQDDVLICAGDSVLVFDKWIAQAGIYAKTGVAANGCDSTYAVQLVVNAPIWIEVEKTVAQPNVPNGTIKVLVRGGTPPFHYNWSIAAAPDTAFIGGLGPGVYFLTVTDAVGCTALIRVPLGTTARSDPADVLQFDLSPNPAAGELKAALRLERIEELSLEIVDATGRVLRKTDRLTASEQTWLLDLTDLPAGVYVCKVWVGERVVARTFVKQ